MTIYPQFVQKLIVTTNYSQTFNFIGEEVDNILRIFYTAAHGAYDSLCHPCLQKLRLASLLVRVSLEKLQYLHLFNRLSIDFDHSN